MTPSGNAADDPAVARARICRTLGFESAAKAHEKIVAGATKGVELLLSRGLKAQQLQKLGYGAASMKKLGYSDRALKRLGFALGPPAGRSPSTPIRAKKAGEAELAQLRRMIDAGMHASALYGHGFTIHHCKKLGCDARELERLGFPLTELILVYGVVELRRSGFGVRELKTFFSGADLKQSGFDAAEMRGAGYSVRDLLNLGYNENHIRTAGYSIVELVREGLSRQTVDKRSLTK